MQNVLLFGGTGFLSWSFLKLSGETPLLLPLRRSALPEGFPKHHKVDLNVDLFDVDVLEKKWEQWRPTAVINTAAISDAKACADQPWVSRALNVDLPLWLARRCARSGSPFVHCSSDLVFDGDGAPYDEGAKGRALSLYGEQKIESEQRVLEMNPKAWVIRCPLLFGESGPWTRNGFREMQQALERGESLRLFTDEKRTPARALKVARFVMDQLGACSGLMNLGGAESLSRYEMGLHLVDVFGGERQQLQALRQADLDLGVPRPKDVSLDSELARGLGYQHGSFKEELLEISAGGGWFQSLVSSK